MASGPVKYGRGYEIYENPFNFFSFRLGLIKPEIFGGVVSKTFTLESRDKYFWHRPRRVLRPIFDGFKLVGFYNRFRLHNPGLPVFIKNFFPYINLDNLVISIGSTDDPEKLIIMIKMLNRIEILATEINLDCPSVDKCFSDKKILREILRKIVECSRHPVITKLGATDNPVNQIANAVNIPVIGIGGIYSLEDCQEFFQAGAKAVGFCSVFFTKPRRPEKIIMKFVKS